MVDSHEIWRTNSHIGCTGWRFGIAVAWFVGWTKLLTLSPVSTGMGDHLQAGIPLWYVTKPTRSTQPCIPPGSLNWVPALIGWGKGENVTSLGWQVTLCDSIWHVSSCRSEACLQLQYFLPLPLPLPHIGYIHGSEKSRVNFESDSDMQVYQPFDRCTSCMTGPLCTSVAVLV